MEFDSASTSVSTSLRAGTLCHLINIRWKYCFFKNNFCFLQLWANEKMETWNAALQCWLMTTINQLIWNDHHAPTSRLQHLVGQTNCFAHRSLYQLWQPSLLFQLLTLTHTVPAENIYTTLSTLPWRWKQFFLTVMFKIWKEPCLESLDYLWFRKQQDPPPPSGWKIKTWKLRRSVWKVHCSRNLHGVRILICTSAKSSSFHGSRQICETVKIDENVGAVCDIHSVAGK